MPRNGFSSILTKASECSKHRRSHYLQGALLLRQDYISRRNQLIKLGDLFLQTLLSELA